DIPVAITERREPFGSISASDDPRENIVPRLGILGVNLDSRIAAMLPALRVRSGVVVASTADATLDARDGGLATGDIISAGNRTRVPGLAELRAVLDGLKIGDPVVLQLERHGELMYLAFTVEN